MVGYSSTPNNNKHRLKKSAKSNQDSSTHQSNGQKFDSQNFACQQKVVSSSKPKSLFPSPASFSPSASSRPSGISRQNSSLPHHHGAAGKSSPPRQMSSPRTVPQQQQRTRNPSSSSVSSSSSSGSCSMSTSSSPRSSPNSLRMSTSVSPRNSPHSFRSTYSPSRASPSSFASSTCYQAPTPASLPLPPLQWTCRELPKDPTSHLKMMLNVQA